MGRLQREFLSSGGTSTSATVGSSDGQTKIDVTAPWEGARIHSFTATQKTAGTGTGSFTVVIEEVGGTDLTAALTIDPDATADVVHGTAMGNGTQVSATGVHLAVATVKTGTVTGSPVLLLNILWQM
jgi:hypothetical protein